MHTSKEVSKEWISTYLCTSCSLSTFLTFGTLLNIFDLKRIGIRSTRTVKIGDLQGVPGHQVDLSVHALPLAQ